MTTLPHFLYLFQSVPIFLPQSFFHKRDSLILEFIWNKKVPRLCEQYLQRSRPFEGLALSNMTFYHWAANNRILKFWLQYETLDPTPTWVTMEARSTKPVSLKAVVHSSTLSSTSPYSKTVLVRTCLRIWGQFKHCFCLQSFSIQAVNTHTFPPSLEDNAFSIWSKQGLVSFQDLYINNTFAFFQQLLEQFSIPKHLTALFGVPCLIPSLSNSNRDVIALVTLLARTLNLTKMEVKNPPLSCALVGGCSLFPSTENK